MSNKLNDSLEVTSGRREDWRQNTWPSVSAAEAGITGVQRIKGQLIPIELLSGLVIQHHWVDNKLVPYDGRINQEDALLVSGVTFNEAKTEVTLTETKWRISDLVFTLAFPLTYPIPAPDSGGLLRIDNIIANSEGQTTYQPGIADANAVAPEVPYKNILVTTIFVSLAETVEEPTPIPVTDGETLFGLGTPASTLGKNGDAYLNNEAGADYGKIYKKELVADVSTWVLKYTPAGAVDISGKVDKVTGKSLIDDTEIIRLAGVSNKFDGTFISLAALQAAFPISLEGHEALVDPGAGTAAVKYIWDEEEGWVPGGGAGASTFAELTGDPADNALLEDRFTAKENKIEKDASGGYAGLTLFKINFKNALNTFTSFFANANTAARTYTFPDKDGTVAMMSDVGSGVSINDTTPSTTEVYSSSKTEGKFLDQSGSKIYAAATGTDTYVATLTPAITAYAVGQHFFVRFANANTGVSTININGLGAKNLFKNGGFGLSAGNILANQIYTIAYDGTNFQIEGNLSGVLPTVASGEKVVTVTVSGGQAIYDTAEQVTAASSLTSADWSTGSVAVTGLQGQISYDSNYRYDCVGTNLWRRSPFVLGEIVDLYLADIDDTAGAKTSAQLQTAYPSSVIGQRVWGTLYLYEKKTTTVWKKMAITEA